MLAGALNGATTSFAITVAGGSLIFAPLGAQYLPHGIAAALVAAVAGGFAASLLSSLPVSLSSPRAASCIVIAGFVATLHRAVPDLPASAVIALTSLTVVTTGILQVFAAALRLGRLMRFVPFPVVSGFTHGVALALFIAFTPLVAGIAEVPRVGFPIFAAWHAGAVVVGGLTLLAILGTDKLSRRLPAIFVGMVAGIAIHLLLTRFVPALDTGAAIATSSVPGVRLPFFEWAAVPQALRDPVMPRIMLSFAVALATVASIDSMIGVMAIESRHQLRSKPDRDLFAQGVGNAIAGALGGAAISYSVAAVNAARSAGGRNWAVGPLSSVLLALIAIAFGVLVESVPLALLGALMIFVATRLADPWGVALLRTMLAKRSRADPIARESFWVYLLVALSIVLLDVVAALAVGLIAASVVFVRTMNQQAVRSVTMGAAIRSRRMYPAAVMPVLVERMRSVAVVELSGPLFFGTADRIADAVGKLPEAIHFVVVDLRRVQALDATASAVIVRTHARLHGEKRTLLLSGRPAGLVAVDGKLPPAFPDRDRAVEWIEARLLEEEGLGHQPATLEAGEAARFFGLSEADTSLILSVVDVQELAAGKTVFETGDASDELYFLVSGRLSIYHEWSGKAGIRVVTFMPGNLFGDVAFIDGCARTATAVCDVDCRLLMLTRAGLAKLAQTQPDLVARIYAALARDIAGRLRAADQILRDETGA